MTDSPNTCEAEATDNIPVPERFSAACEKHGNYEGFRFRSPVSGVMMQSICPACVEADILAQQERENRQLGQQVGRAKISERLGRSGIPKRFQDRTLDNYRASNDGQRRVHGIAKRFVQNFGKPGSAGSSLIFAGAPGTGKTHLACGIGHILIAAGRPVLFGTVLSIVRHVKDTYRRDSERTETEAYRDLLLPDLLIVDEVGAQVGSEHELMTLFEIINSRYQDCRSTILISNLNRKELTDFLGDRMIDRFDEAGAVLGFDWPSYRRERK